MNTFSSVKTLELYSVVERSAVWSLLKCFPLKTLILWQISIACVIQGYECVTCHADTAIISNWLQSEDWLSLQKTFQKRQNILCQTSHDFSNSGGLSYENSDFTNNFINKIQIFCVNLSLISVNIWDKSRKMFTIGCWWHKKWMKCVPDYKCHEIYELKAIRETNKRNWL